VILVHADFFEAGKEKLQNHKKWMLTFVQHMVMTLYCLLWACR
jgi:hypothetical protein